MLKIKLMHLMKKYLKKVMLAWWGGFAPQGLYRFVFLLLCSDPLALVAGLVEASKSNLLSIQRRKAKTLWLGAFEDIQSDFINHRLYSP